MIARTAFLASFALSSSALACPTPPDATQLIPEADHAPAAYAEMNTPPLSAPFAMLVTFCDPAQKIEALMFDALMPAHRHGMNFTVDVSKIADNRFEVSNIVFHMPGLWELQFGAEFAGRAYTYIAEVQVK
ncbi:hypothetical protein [Shimia sp. Alg240-R146]|uniref:hypothetical protein n=1 Tax=Shimia sp. Alg240-R146 TaxID=2993449 RepID=UPI0022DF0E90|nr:hypothetical protein [Shimia sp. Alg240-R146]